jgi:alpha-beta hydrolase superfamily lysophospholipase
MKRTHLTLIAAVCALLAGCASNTQFLEEQAKLEPAKWTAAMPQLQSPSLLGDKTWWQAWNNPELFTKQGSLFNADKINTPLLLLHGTVDTNVPIGESIQLFNALKILGKTVEFITVDGENHFIADYPKRVQWHNSIMAWFARWLQDSPQWWEDMYPERHL